MPEKNESVFIAESQSLDIDEQKKNDILSVIESCNDFQDFIKKLEEENLTWHFIGPLCRDKDIIGQINFKWKKEFQKFEQSIDATYKELKSFLPGQSFLAYTKDNNFNIRFENEEKPIEISNILKATSEGKVYNISLGEGSQIAASKKNGNERHYNFTGTSSCAMTINWQAKDSKGNSIDCSMTVEVDSSGIKRVVSEPKFGGITNSEEALELVKQNKEVFINGKTLHQAFAESMDNSEIIQSQPSSISPSTPSSRRSSFSSVSEFSSEFEDDMSGNEEEYEQEESKDEIINAIEELEEEKEIFADCFAAQAKQLEDSKLEIEKLQHQLKEKEDMLTCVQEELRPVKDSLEQLQEENKQLKQQATQNAALSSAGQKEAKEEEVIPQNIMDWPVPIPDDKPEEQKTPLEPIKVNTELSEPKLTPAEVSEKNLPPN